jgi:hypothetical protein
MIAGMGSALMPFYSDFVSAHIRELQPPRVKLTALG